MPVPSAISDLSTTPALNSPAGSESPALVDDYLRTHAAFIKQVSDASVKTTGDQTVAGIKTFTDPAVVAVNNSGSALRITQTGTGNALLVEDSANPDSTPFVIDQSGNVGIGTTAPNSRLHVQASDVSQAWGDNGADLVKVEGSVHGLNLVTSTTGFVSFSDADARSQGLIEYVHASDYMGFRTGGSERMRIDASGNVNVSVTARNPQLTDNDLSFDLTARNNFVCTTSGNGTLTFTNIASAAGQSGFIELINASNHVISKAATTRVDSNFLSIVSATGTYLISYFCDGTNVFCATTGATS